MIALSEYYPMTPESFLEWEAQQTQKYEYIEGQIYAMTGGTIPHTEIALNVATHWRGIVMLSYRLKRNNRRHSNFYIGFLFALFSSL